MPTHHTPVFVVVAKADVRKVFAPYCGTRRLFMESDQDNQERWDSASGRYFRYHVDILACTWLMKARRSDIRAAETWARTEGWSVVVVPGGESSPLSYAREVVKRRIDWANPERQAIAKARGTI